MAGQRRTSEARRTELIDAALHVIATKGIAALTTRSLAGHIGLSSGAIFRHFTTLDVLLDGVVARVEAVLAATFPAATLPPLARLERFIDARSTAVGSQLGILRLVLSEQFLLVLPKNGSGRISKCVQTTRAFVLECLREGQTRGEIRNDVPAESLAPIVMGTVQMLALSHSNARQRVIEGRTVGDALLALLRPASPAAARRDTSTFDPLPETR